eukprot:4970836-Amphidinium_carterae.1
METDLLNWFFMEMPLEQRAFQIEEELTYNIGAKHVPAPVMWKHLTRMGIERRPGEAESALNA